jgi:16S rRNA G966 N2-methylase RsmD
MRKTFPYRKITKQEALKDYENLRNMKSKLTIDKSIIGNKATDKFFQVARSKARTKKLTHLEAWKNPKTRKEIIEFAKRFKNTENPTDSDLRDAIIFRYGSINQFKPAVARFVYKKFKPKRILDFTAGWGGRLLAAMSLDIDYIGIDSNKQLRLPYKKMIETYPSKSNINMYFKKAEDMDFSKLPEYDLVFTSPPYFDLEIYPGMKDYESKENFIKEFFEPVIRKSFKYLKKGGHMILNIPLELQKEFNKFKLCKNLKPLKMPISNRFSDGTPRFELIYICKKK